MEYLKELIHIRFMHALLNIIKGVFYFLIYIQIIFLLPDQIIFRLHMFNFLGRYGHILGPLCTVATSILAGKLLDDLIIKHSKNKNEKAILKSLKSMESECAAFVYYLHAIAPYHSINCYVSIKNYVSSLESDKIIIRSGINSYVLNPVVIKLINDDCILEHFLKVLYRHYNHTFRGYKYD